MLNAVFGNGLALLLAGAAYLLAKNRYHFSRWRLVVEGMITTAVIFMALAGELLRATGIGHLIMSVIIALETMAGHVGLVIIAVGLLYLLFKVGAAIAKTATDKEMTLAFAIPFGLALFHTGIFAQIDQFLQLRAGDVATYIAHHIGV